VKAGAVLLADEQTGQVLYERGADRPRAMASTTKVMTALLALERLDQRRTVVIGAEPTTVGEESLELRKGERFTVHQLLVGLLVKSANDAAVALADAVDGTAAKFVGRMNQRAAQLGLRETHYVTPYGLDRPGHHTSARDLARLWEVAMRRADFRSLVSMRGGQLPGASPQRKFVNTNQLLGSYPWVVGGKTGFTDDAGRCLAAAATRNGRTLIAVVLHSPNPPADATQLMNWGFGAGRNASTGRALPPYVAVPSVQALLTPPTTPTIAPVASSPPGAGSRGASALGTRLERLPRDERRPLLIAASAVALVLAATGFAIHRRRRRPAAPQ
jgi:D-alanyl-D-alanine carboxypeptidase (penicillin-binding protein 5/6)